jgi:alpha-1,2-mannosyltransferase
MKEYHAFSFENKLQNQILSIAQFRPEKNHLLQLKAFQLVLMKWKKTGHVHFSKPKFVILGSCRHEEDFNRAKKLQEISKQMQIDEYVHFVINATYEQLKQYLATSSFGLHTMYNEHFGISIVEMMAAGLIVVANNSGGPAQDIIKPWTGFLALTAEEYATHLLNCFEENPSQILETRKIARNAALRFTDEEFTKDFIHATRPLIFEIFT